MARANNLNSKSKTAVNVNDVLIGVIVILVVCVIIKECKNNKQVRIEAFYQAEAAPEVTEATEAPTEGTEATDPAAEGSISTEECWGKWCFSSRDARMKFITIFAVVWAVVLVVGVIIWLIIKSRRNSGKPPMKFPSFGNNGDSPA
jgi:hypothetical protein